MNIQQMKIGQRLVFGSYAPRSLQPVKIRWLKADQDCKFISENVLDTMIINPVASGVNDRGQRQPYYDSCLSKFLNSDAEAFDAPLKPSWYNGKFEQDGYSGFLYGFEESEIEAMVPMPTVIDGEEREYLVRVPLNTEIYGGDAGLRLFKRKGKRARLINYNYSEPVPYDSFCSFLLAQKEYGCRTVNAMGYEERYYYNQIIGVRPVIQLRSDTELKEDPNTGIFLFKSAGASKMQIPETESLFSFYFGLA